uniref:Glycerol-3-phosphate dehydrogenase [NAD(+)] n=1 Tax=Ditylenchus dipsaci TaxID=166011 RepID=A0A915EEC1_9BILA
MTMDEVNRQEFSKGERHWQAHSLVDWNRTSKSEDKRARQLPTRSSSQSSVAYINPIYTFFRPTLFLGRAVFWRFSVRRKPKFLPLITTSCLCSTRFYTSSQFIFATMAPRKVTIVGSGNWGSAIARIVGNTVKTHSSDFDERVNMWVFEEVVDGKNLSEIINTQHENVKYLPGKKLPSNVVAVTDLFVPKICNSLKGKVKQDAIAISLIKGLSEKKAGGIRLVTEEIKQILGINVAVLMGANLAPEVASDNFCEATIGTTKRDHGVFLKKLFHTDNFKINVVEDAHTVELCGALKNIVACAAGFTDGLGYGDNTKAAVIRLGLMETIKFVKDFYPGSTSRPFSKAAELLI